MDSESVFGDYLHNSFSSIICEHIEEERMLCAYPAVFVCTTPRGPKRLCMKHSRAHSRVSLPEETFPMEPKQQLLKVWAKA